MIVENLLQFGLNEKEVNVYLTLVSIGPSPVREISKRAGVNRGTTYDILKGLIDQGLVVYYKKYHQEDKRQYFVAEPPQRLLDLIENKKRGLETLKAQMNKSIPELESLYEKSSKPVVKYYEGSSGIKTILEDVLNTVSLSDEKNYYVYSSADIRHYLYKAFPDFTKKRIAGEISVQAISIGEGGETSGLDERRWLSREKSSPSYVLIYKGKLALITLDAVSQPVGVIIEDMGLYKTQELVFKQIWESLDN